MGNPKSNRLLLLAAAQSYRGSAFEAAAQKLGAEIVIGEDVPLPMHADSTAALPLDYRDIPQSKKAILAYAQKHPIQAILGLDDSGTILAAEASAELGLIHNLPAAALSTRDKHIMRQCFADHNVPSPLFKLHKFTEDIQNLSLQVSYPCVIKPTMMSGSRGVMRANNPDEFTTMVRRLQAILVKQRCNEFLVEDYIPGLEIAVEGLMDSGALHILAVFDKPDPLEGPFFEETIYVTPSRLPETSQAEIISAAEKAALALGLVNGPIHIELRYNETGPWLLEVAGRSIGGLCGQTLRFKNEATLEELIMRQALGLDLSASAISIGADGVMMIPIPNAGLLTEVIGLEDAKNVSLIDDIKITAPMHYPLIPLPEGNSYLGFIFASGNKPSEVESALRLAYSKLEFRISPELPVIQPNQDQPRPKPSSN